jgi:hypothetical protein
MPHDAILLIQNLDWVLGVRQVSLERSHFRQHDVHRCLQTFTLVATCGRCRELQLQMVAGQACKPQFHTSQGWGMVRCSEVLIFLLPRTSSCLSWVKLSNTQDFQLWSPKVDTSCLHKSLGVILRLSSYLGYDEWLLQLLWQGPVQR